MKRLFVTLGIVALGVISTPAAAASEATSEPAAGCGQGFELMSVEEVLTTIVAPGFEEAIVAADKNADQFLCIKILPNFPDVHFDFDPAFIFLDNPVPLR